MERCRNVWRGASPLGQGDTFPPHSVKTGRTLYVGDDRWGGEGNEVWAKGVVMAY